jgi:TonB-dependent receptor
VLLVFQLTTLLAPTLGLRAQDGGRVSGRVLAQGSTLPLIGAHVTIEGTTLAATTNEQGRFVLPRVPVGAHTVRVTYIGRTPASAQINVANGQTTMLDVELATITLTPVTVRASSQSEALSRQQNAPNIRSVVAADQMGRFPDASAPEALQRLPGVALQRDQGEGRYIQLRGSSAATTQVMVNGEQIGPPEADARQIALDAIPVGVLASVEVSKAITPDMDADAIGGAVNLLTKRAGFSRTFTVEGSGGFSMLREKSAGTAAITYGDRTADSRLGWLFSGSFGERNFGSDDIEPDYDDADLAELEVRHYSLWRRRSGFTGAIDFRAGDNTTLYLNGLWSELQDHEQRRIQAHLVEDNELAFLHKNRLEKLSTFNLLAGAEHSLARGMLLDYRLGVTRSQEDTPFDIEAAFLQEDVDFDPSRSDPEKPQPNPLNNALNGTYVFDELATGGTLTRNRDLVGAINFSFPFSMGNGSAVMKLGAKYRDKNKDQSVDAFEVGLASGASDIVLGTDVGSSFNNAGFNPGTYPIPFLTSPGDIKNFESRFAASLDDREAVAEEQTGAYELSERVVAAYAMAELNFGRRLMLLPGLRFENTSLTSDGFEFDADTEELTAQTGENSYSNIFPMLHLRYRLDDLTNVRAAFTSTIFRPNFIDLVPYIIIDGEDVEQGNPDLEPTTASNFDLMLERYDNNIGLISAGVFFKRLDKPIFAYTSDNTLGGETTQPVNAESGEILGFEVALQRRFTSLPGVLSGLGVYANYTWTDSKATQPNGRETRLAGQAEYAFNLAVSYERGRFSGQVSMNTVGRYIDELGEDADDDLFADERTQIDLSASLFVTPVAQVFLEAVNLTNQPYRTYLSATDRVRQLEFYEPSLQLGLRWRP